MDADRHSRPCNVHWSHLRRPFLTSWLFAVAVLVAPSGARADRPTSGDMSLRSGRTLGVDETAFAAGIGWPSLWAETVFAPSSTFNVGPRLDVLYGSPWMGVSTGVGGSVSLPMRVHVFGEKRLDLSVSIRPLAALGEGSILGQRGVFGGNLGWTVGTEAGVLGGFQASDEVTLAFGAGGAFGYAAVPDADDGDVLGSTFVRLGIEGLVSRDTMLFGEVIAGYGFAPDGAFDGQGIIRVSLGLAYLL
jgi:hypothetical protein